MYFANVHQQMVNVFGDKQSVGVDPCNQLRNNLQPGVLVNYSDAIGYCFGDLRRQSIVKPESE